MNILSAEKNDDFGATRRAETRMLQVSHFLIYQSPACFTDLTIRHWRLQVMFQTDRVMMTRQGWAETDGEETSSSTVEEIAQRMAHNLIGNMRHKDSVRKHADPSACGAADSTCLV